jgi:hypothetical protein
MSERHDTAHILEAAERAAIGGDLASAEEQLREAARLQEAELGPLHPDLANTLNNLAIVTEKTGRPGDAEAFYRRAASIAAASLPANHPMVAASRQNLEDFCRARGVPVDAPVEAPVISPPSTRDTTPPAPRRSSASLAWAAIGVSVLVAAAVIVQRPWSSRETLTPVPETRPVAPRVPEPLPPAPVPPDAPAPIEQPQRPPVEPRKADREGPPTSAVTLITAQLCATFATSGGRWRCDQAGDSVAPGPLVFYTRVRSPRSAQVVHRWYRGDTLRQSVSLAIGANAAEGYRTYSRQTVDGGADWRVEVRTADGDLLHEQRFVVR